MGTALVEPSAQDFLQLDFARLWRSRVKTTNVEAGVVDHSLGSADTRRVLEVGPGGGRLTPGIRARATEFVAADVTRPFLERLDPKWFDPPGSLRAAATVYRLPFADHSFTCVVLVRVYNFLTDPVRAFQELRRVLIPGGRLLVSYEPRPSLATLVADVRSRFTGAPAPGPSMTFTRAPVVEVRPSAIPARASTRAAFQETLRAGGFRPVREYPTGLEDYRPFKWLPAQIFLSFAMIGGRAGAGVVPSLFQVAETPASADETPTLRPLAESVACPECRRPIGRVELDRGWSRPCPTCGTLVSLRAGILQTGAEASLSVSR